MKNIVIILLSIFVLILAGMSFYFWKNINIKQDLTEKEIKILKIAEGEIIKKFGEDLYNKEKTYNIKKYNWGSIPSNLFVHFGDELDKDVQEGFYHVSGTLNCEGCVGGVAEVWISEKHLKVLDIYHTK